MTDMKKVWARFIYQTEEEIRNTRVMTGKELKNLVERKNKFKKALSNLMEP